MITQPKNELYNALLPKLKSNIDKTATFINQARQVHGYRYDYSISVYRGSHEKIEVICRFHGRFFITPNLHIHLKSDCPYCARKRFIPELFLANVNKIHGQYIYHDLELIQYRGSADMIKIECPVHGIFHQRLDSHLNGSGCPECVDRPYNYEAEAKYKSQKLSFLT